MIICPFNQKGLIGECVKEHCGIWDWTEKQCSFVSIANGSMEYIREKEGRKSDLNE